MLLRLILRGVLLVRRSGLLLRRFDEHRRAIKSLVRQIDISHFDIHRVYSWSLPHRQFAVSRSGRRVGVHRLSESARVVAGIERQRSTTLEVSAFSVGRLFRLRFLAELVRENLVLRLYGSRSRHVVRVVLHI